MDRCKACPGVNACLPPDGHGDILFIGEAPGKEENKLGRVFVRRVGRELDEHYLLIAGLRRSSVMITQAIACMPSTAVCPDVHLDIDHGIPAETPWGIPAFPMYHPALGMHSPKQMLHIRTDWLRLKKYLKGSLILPMDESAGFEDYAEVTDPDELDAIDPTLPLACDTESSKSKGPYCFTYSQRAGTGRLIRASRADLLLRLQQSLDAQLAPILFHNWFYDYAPMAGLGLTIPPRLLRDTMVMAFNLGNLPQGLKALSKRKLGMVMQDFEDLVFPYSQARVLDYYRQAQTEEWPKPEPRMERDSKTGEWKMKNPQGMNTKLKRFFTDFGKNADKDVFQMWEKNWEDEQAMIEAKLGPWPGWDIAFVRFEDVLHYACRDADATIRLWPLLLAMRERVRDFAQEEWDAA